MSEIMKKLLEQKSKGEMMPDHERDAKMSVLHELKKHMDGMMADKASGLKKVSVMADSPEALKEGLDKAKELISHKSHFADGGEVEPHSEFHDARRDLPSDVDDPSEESEEEDQSEEEMSPEEIDAKIAELMALKAQKKA